MAEGSDRLDELRAKLREFVQDRDWEQFHDPKNLTMCLASEVGELLAEYRWVANAESDTHSRNAEARARISAEIGDIGIALLLLSDRMGLDIVEAMTAKLAQNAEKYPPALSRGRPEAPSSCSKAIP